MITGIKLSVFNANNANANTLIKTIAGTMTGVSTNSVMKLEVTDVPISAARLDSTNVTSTASSQAATSSAIQVKYTVKLSTGLSAEQLWAELSAAVVSGSFNTDLHANALNSNTNLLGCTSSSASARHFSDEREDELSGGAIFGVVAGALFIGVMAVGAIYVLYFRKGQISYCEILHYCTKCNVEPISFIV